MRRKSPCRGGMKRNAPRSAFPFFVLTVHRWTYLAQAVLGAQYIFDSFACLFYLYDLLHHFGKRIAVISSPQRPACCSPSRLTERWTSESPLSMISRAFRRVETIWTSDSLLTQGQWQHLQTEASADGKAHLQDPSSAVRARAS